MSGPFASAGPWLGWRGGAACGWYCNRHADQLASQAQALQPTDPAAARTVWEQLYRLVSNQAPVVPFLSKSPTVFVSARVRNYQAQPMYGPMLDQIWVR